MFHPPISSFYNICGTLNQLSGVPKLIIKNHSQILRKIDMTYRTAISKFASADDRPLQVNHHSHFNFCQFLSFLDHFNQHFMFLVLDGAHIYAEYISALLYQLAYSFLHTFDGLTMILARKASFFLPS
jgi:hypothetical protein